MSASPELAVVTEADGVDRYLFEEIRKASDKWARARIPARFAEATVTVPAVAEWVRGLVRQAVEHRGMGDPLVRRGPSLLLSGITGTGKTHEAYGALRALQHSGAVCHWEMVHELEMFDRMRPRQGADSEEEFQHFADADLLVVDDFGSERRTDWTETRHLRLVNHRYERMLPTLITTNVLPKDYTARFGERVTSRLDEMCVRVTLTGSDRRRGRDGNV